MSQSVAVLGSNVVPLQYKVPVPGTLTALSASGTFDGTSSATFQPCLSFYDSDGNLLVRATAPVVAAGESAEISWFPRVGAAATATGLQFDTDNEGGWFFGAVNAPGGGPNGYGWQFDTGGSDLPFAVTGDGGMVVDTAGTVNVAAGSGFTASGGAGNSTELDSFGNITETIGAVAPGTHTWSVKSDVGSPLFSVADDGTIDAEGNRITNGADGVAATDFATVGQIGTGGVTDIDGITGAVTLVAGANVTIVDNSPSAGGITISAAGGGGGSGAELVYRYTVTGSDKASIDTGVDTPDAGSNDWTAGSVLEVWIVARTDKAVVFDALDVTVNNDTAAHYDRETLEIVGTSVGGGPEIAATAWHPNVHGASGGASYPGMIAMTLPGYTGTTFFKVGESRSSVSDQTAANNLVDVESWGYRSTSAITRMKVAAQGSQKLKVGSELLIYKLSAF